jgi:hypothetical protein
MCQNFTCEVVGQRRKLKAILKNCSSKNKCHFIYTLHYTVLLYSVSICLFIFVVFQAVWDEEVCALPGDNHLFGAGDEGPRPRLPRALLFLRRVQLTLDQRRPFRHEGRSGSVQVTFRNAHDGTDAAGDVSTRDAPLSAAVPQSRVPPPDTSSHPRRVCR